MEDTFEENTPTQSEQLYTLPTSTNEVIMPTEKVGCILVTSHLKQFLEDYPLSSEKQVFIDIYHMLSLLDKYLYDHPKKHTHCMSSDNEYVTSTIRNPFAHRFNYVSNSLGCALYSLQYSRWQMQICKMFAGRI